MSDPAPDIRSKRCVFLSHCLLAQVVRAEGLAKYYPGPMKPVVQFCLDNDINMMQMPCPESNCMAGGLNRQPQGKKWYEEHGLRPVATGIAEGQVAYMKALVDAGMEIMAIIGVEFSPACGVTYLNKGPVIYKASGIYVEELKNHMARHGLDIPMIGVNPSWHKKLANDLDNLIHPRPIQEELF